MRKDWFALSVVAAYTGFLSYAVLQMLDSDISARVRLVLLAGWGAFLVPALLVVILVALKKGDLIYRELDRFSRAVRIWNPWVKGLVCLGLVALSAPLAYTNVSRGLMEHNLFRYAILFALYVCAVQFWPFRKPEGALARFLPRN